MSVAVDASAIIAAGKTAVPALGPDAKIGHKLKAIEAAMKEAGTSPSRLGFAEYTRIVDAIIPPD